MAGKLTLNPVQINDSATASNNFVLKADNLGGLKLSRGNDGATSQDIFTVDSDGNFTAVSVPAFFARRANTVQRIATGADSLIIFNSEEADALGNYDPATGIFTAPVTGYYQFSASYEANGGSGANYGYLMFKVAGITKARTLFKAYSATSVNASFSTVLYVSSGQTVGVYALTDLVTADISTGNDSTFSGALLRTG